MRRRVYIVGNPLDDRTRAERGIATDSPAASRKVFMLARLLRDAGLRVVVLSLGRGREDGRGAAHARMVRRIAGVAVVYLRFTHRRVSSKLLSAFEPIASLWHQRSSARSSTVLFYNRLPGYVPALVAARLLGYRTALDLEDGEVGYRTWSPAGLAAGMTRWLFDRICDGGALLACSALASMTNQRPTLCYYGTVDPADSPMPWPRETITVLLGGTLAPATGAPLLVNAIRAARLETESTWGRLRVIVTGYGESVTDFERLAAEPGSPLVDYRGRLSDAEYREVLGSAQIGLALKPAGGALAHSTFPSKVVELASRGLLVLSTDISDVRRVLGDGALYLVEERAETLLDLLRGVIADPGAAEHMARRGQRHVRAHCAPDVIGAQVAAFLVGPLG